MVYRVLADLALALHLGFIIFVVLGGLTRTGFIVLGLGVVAANLAIYGWIYRRTRRR